MQSTVTRDISPADGKLAILLPGLGAVSTTFIAGVELIRRGAAQPVGSFTQMGTVAVGATGRTNHRKQVPVGELVPISPLSELTFGAWDIINEDAAAVAKRSGVLSREHVEDVFELLRTVKPKKGVYDPQSVRRIAANHFKAESKHRDRIDALRKDIRDFMRELRASRAVMVFCASTETYRNPEAPATKSLESFERALDQNDPAISPTMLYAYAALKEKVPFANGTPNASVDTPAMIELAEQEAVPICGKDFKSGQTMLKTALAPAFKARLLGLQGWFSGNILGNRDGEVLDDPDAFRSKEVTKSGVLDSILEPEKMPELYGKISHKVAIHYYPPRGDAKEGWDNIDIFGWMGYPMQIKVNFLCRDSILAAPLVLDLALFMDLAKRAGMKGPQDWLSFYFKSPMPDARGHVVHDLFLQEGILHDQIRTLAGAEDEPGQSAF